MFNNGPHFVCKYDSLDVLTNWVLELIPPCDESWCIDCNETPFPTPVFGDHCKPRGTCPLSEFDLKHPKKHFQMHFLANFTTTVDPQDALFLLSFSCIFDKAWHQHPDIPQNIAKQRKRKFFQTESQWWTNKVQVVKGCKIRPLFFANYIDMLV